MNVTRAILALEKDLFFSVRIRDTLQHHDMDVTVVRNLNAFGQALASDSHPKPALAIVDIATKGIDWEAAIRTARAHACPVLAFGSHMDLDARAKALAAGAQKVVANSKFTKDMPGLVQRLIDAPTATATSIEDDDFSEE